MTNTETRFLELVSQARPIAKSARLLDRIVEDHFLCGFDAAPGIFVVVPRGASPQQVAVALAIREVERQAVEAFQRSRQMVREGALHPMSERVQ